MDIEPVDYLLNAFPHHGRWDDDFAAYNREDDRRWVGKHGGPSAPLFGYFLR